MADSELLKILKQGVDSWNQWRVQNHILKPSFDRPGLMWSYLSEANLSLANLEGAFLSGADLSGANLADTNLCSADLSESNLIGANLSGAKLIGANLKGAYLSEASLSRADLSNANLSDADLENVNLSDALLNNLNLTDAIVGWTKFININLADVDGLDTIRHRGPSTLGIDTLYKSRGELSDDFLRGCGVPEEFITFLPSLLGSIQALKFYSCFISYSHLDEEFARRLYARMRDMNLRVWYAPENIKGGRKLSEQIEAAIYYHDKLLVVLSNNSLQSEWVMTEIRKARESEIRERRRKLFPIRLVNMEVIQNWKCFDADTGKDLAVEVREYFIPDFSNWTDEKAFEVSYAKLINDLKPEE